MFRTLSIVFAFFTIALSSYSELGVIVELVIFGVCIVISMFVLGFSGIEFQRSTQFHLKRAGRLLYFVATAWLLCFAAYKHLQSALNAI